MWLASNKILVRHYLEEAYRGNFDIIEEAIADDYVATAGPLPPARDKANNAALSCAFPDRRIRIHAIMAEGDRVAAHTTDEATHHGEWRGIPPSGRRVTRTGTIMRRVRGGKIVRGDASFDRMGAMQQLGATFAPPAPVGGATA